jgi:hypothetical protein
LALGDSFSTGKPLPLSLSLSVQQKIVGGIEDADREAAYEFSS